LLYYYNNNKSAATKFTGFEMNSFQNIWRPLTNATISNCLIHDAVNPSMLTAANVNMSNPSYYYEVKILSDLAPFGKLSFGFIGSNNHQCVDDYKQESFLFHNNGEMSINQYYVNFFHNNSFKKNDVIGCGIDLGGGKGYFTYNGHLIFSFSNFYRSNMHYYPALLCEDKDTIEFESNFGAAPFIYSGQNIINSIFNMNNENNTNDTVSSYNMLKKRSLNLPFR